jgi:hypothetical protein
MIDILTAVGRRRLILGALGWAVWRSPALRTDADPIEVALADTFEALRQGALPWKADGAADAFKTAARDDFKDAYGTYWADYGKKVVRVGRHTGRLAAVLHECYYAPKEPPDTISTDTVLKAAALVKASKACTGLRGTDSRGRFCTKAHFANLADAKALFGI